MSYYFIDPKKNSKQLLGKKLSSLSYYIGMGLFIGLLCYIAYFIKDNMTDGSIISQIIFNWAISILVFLILIGLYQHHYSYRKYLLLSPKEWISTVENSYDLISAKFELNQGRKFIIDRKSFSFLSEIQEGKFIGSIILFLIISLSLSTYPYFDYYGFNVPKNYMYFFFGCIVVLIIFIFFLDYIILRYNNLAWEFIKKDSDIIDCSIKNSKNNIFNENIHKSTLERMQIVEKSLLDLYPDSRFFKNLKAKTKVFILSVTLPSYLLNTTNESHSAGAEFILSMHSSREFVELIKELLTTWLAINQ